VLAGVLRERAAVASFGSYRGFCIVVRMAKLQFRDLRSEDKDGRSVESKDISRLDGENFKR
jgi:hypothetical protein